MPKFTSVEPYHSDIQVKSAFRAIVSPIMTTSIHSGINCCLNVEEQFLCPMLFKHLPHHIPRYVKAQYPVDIVANISWYNFDFDLSVWVCPVYIQEEELSRLKLRSLKSNLMELFNLCSSTDLLVSNISRGSIKSKLHIMLDVLSPVATSQSEVVFYFNSRVWKKVFEDSSLQYIVDTNSKVSGIIKLQDLISLIVTFNSEDTAAMLSHYMKQRKVQVLSNDNSKIRSTLFVSATLEEATYHHIFIVSICAKKDKVQSHVKVDERKIETMEKFMNLIELPSEVTITKVSPKYWIFKAKIAPYERFPTFKARYYLRSDFQEEDLEILIQQIKLDLTLLPHVWETLLDYGTSSVNTSSISVHKELRDGRCILLPKSFKSNNSSGLHSKLKKFSMYLTVVPFLSYNYLWSTLEMQGLEEPVYGINLLLSNKQANISHLVDDFKMQITEILSIHQYAKALKDQKLELIIEETFTTYLKKKRDALDMIIIKLLSASLILKTIVGNTAEFYIRKLQSGNALNTSEEEYKALSYVMRVLIFIRKAWLQIIAKVDMINFKLRNPFGNESTIDTFPTTAYEYISNVLSLALNQEVTSQTKYWRESYHFIRSYMIKEDNNTTCVRMDTEHQNTYYLTKGSSKIIFRKCHCLNQGW